MASSCSSNSCSRMLVRRHTTSRGSVPAASQGYGKRPEWSDMSVRTSLLPVLYTVSFHDQIWLRRMGMHTLCIHDHSITSSLIRRNVSHLVRYKGCFKVGSGEKQLGLERSLSSHVRPHESVFTSNRILNKGASASQGLSSASDKIWNRPDFVVVGILSAAAIVLGFGGKCEYKKTSADAEEAFASNSSNSKRGELNSLLQRLQGINKIGFEDGKRPSFTNNDQGNKVLYQRTGGYGSWDEERNANEAPDEIFAEGKQPYEVSIRAIKGGRLAMEDEYFIAEGGRFTAVFDGHGGSGVSKYLRDNLYYRMRYYLCDGEMDDTDEERRRKESLAAWLALAGDPSAASSKKSFSIASIVAALTSAFREVDREVLEKDQLHHQGSTAVVVTMHEGDDGGRTLISANLGDSRAVLSRRKRPIDLTRDHKPNDPKEKKRIHSLGENIEWDSYCGVWRVRSLSLSRAIGDRFAKPTVSSQVEIKRFPIAEDGDEFIILASDGLWDVMSSQDAVNFVHNKLESPISLDESSSITRATRRRHMSRFVANEALRRGTGDNVCVVIVWLDKQGRNTSSLSRK